MNCQRTREVFPDLLDRRMAPGANPEAQAHLANCPDCQREFALLSQTASALDALPAPPPPPSLRRNFYAMLEEEKHSAASVHRVAEREHRARRIFLWRWVISPIGAFALVVFGFALGQHSSSVPGNQAPAEDNTTKRELAAMRQKLDEQHEQINRMTQLVGYSILQQQQNPANQRLNEVLVAARQDQPTDRTVDDLVSALTLDPSANVRLRAIEALYPHAKRELVRAGIVAALPREQNPLVQLDLIEFVAAAQVHNATPVLEKIAADQASNHMVRGAARLALAQL